LAGAGAVAAVVFARRHAGLEWHEIKHLTYIGVLGATILVLLIL
jgi:hypothetical protein